MIQHVYELISRAEGLDDIVVATDDARIADAVRAFGGKVFMTSPDCQSGSDRVREVASSLAADIYINVQGDEPLLEPSAIEKLLSVFRSDGGVRVATLCSPISEEPARSPHQVKVVCDDAGNALYFSRSLIPYVRERLGASPLPRARRHLCLQGRGAAGVSQRRRPHWKGWNSWNSSGFSRRASLSASSKCRQWAPG